MAQHISIRVPWHDHGWDGTVCQDPRGNNACLRLKNIYENRDDAAEADICGQCMIALQKAYFDCKADNRKYTQKKYKKDNE